MAEPLESILTKFTDKELDLDQACRAISAWAASHQGDEKFIGYGRELIEELHSSQKIGEGMKSMLLNALNTPALSDDDEEDEKTVVIGRDSDDDDDRTQVLSDDDEEEDAKTVFLGGDAEDDDDDDKTQVLIEDDEEEDAKTVFLGGGASTASEDDSDKTRVINDDEDDAKTVFLGGAAQTGTSSLSDDDATIVAGDKAPYDDDATVVAGNAGATEIDDDATIIASGATEIDDDATVVAGATPADADDDATQIAAPAKDTSTTTGRSRTDVDMTGRKEDFGVIHASDDEDDEELVVGSILKERFNLVSVLGEGGMGKVFKAVDMLKVEAKDANPYVAIKLLTGDFKEHPDAFIALQRETSKAQKLAHPNISTVYDFDRHKGTVYMTMELLNGKPLDEFIKEDMPKEGLNQQLALSIIQGLGEGLEYAHEQGLVHSDFKPGNAFILDIEDLENTTTIEAGGVKVIDFGIARAASTSTGEKSLHEDDVFDAGSLGALTPAYATIEMYNGDDPHPSDDIYALACVCCQLLTGVHPYKKKPAPKAKDLGLKPPVIPGFTKRQQRAFEKALAFERKNRTESIEEFLDGIRYRKDYTLQIAAGLLLSFALIGGLGYTPVKNYYEQQEIQELIVATNEGTDSDIKQVLQDIELKTPEYRSSVLVGIRERALEVYSEEITALVDASRDRHEYVKAEAKIKEILRYYPDSSVIAELSSQVEASKQVLLGSLRASYIEHLLQKRFLPIDEQEDMVDTLALLKSVDSSSDIFTDPRLESEYQKAISSSIKKGELDTAEQHLEIANRFIPKSNIFRDLGDQVKIARLDEALVLEQNKTEKSLEGQNLTIHDYKNAVDDLLILSIASDFRSREYSKFKDTFETEFSKLLERSPTDAKNLYTTFAVALSANDSLSYSDRTGLVPKTIATVTASVYPKIDFIKDNTDSSGVVKHLERIRRSVEKYRNSMLSHYNANFETAMEPLVTSQRPTLISFYNRIYSDLLLPETTAIVKEQMTVARNSVNANIRKVDALATVENDKRIFRNRAKENRLIDSIRSYEKIASVASEHDAEFLEFARSEIARMYSTLAESNATEFNFENAYNNILKAKEYLVNEQIEKQERNYKKEVMSEEVAALITTREETDKVQAEELLQFMKSEYVDDVDSILNRITDIVNVDIIKLAESELIEAHRLKKHALSVVNTYKLRTVPIKDLPPPSILAAQGKLEVSQFNLSAAKATLQEAVEKTPDHYQVQELREALNAQLEIAEEYYEQFERYYAEEQYDAANVALRSAIENWKDNLEYNSKRAYYDRVMAQVDMGSKLCREDLQGIGKRNRGACNDIITSTRNRAPTMVVIPPISKDEEPYAISKYEISVGDLNTFCAQSDVCAPRSEDLDGFPATGIEPEVIEQYAKWLSEQTGFDYRIASYKEWFNATNAAGREGNSDYNCRLRLGTKLIKGQNIVPVESGAQNNWGLINYVGNVDEIVQDDNGLKLVGGNFSDSISDCKIQLTKPYSNNNLAGFRLVRSMN